MSSTVITLDFTQNGDDLEQLLDKTRCALSALKYRAAEEAEKVSNVIDKHFDGDNEKAEKYFDDNGGDLSEFGSDIDCPDSLQAPASISEAASEAEDIL